jgi:hypothetical protein
MNPAYRDLWLAIWAGRMTRYSLAERDNEEWTYTREHLEKVAQFVDLAVEIADDKWALKEDP